MKPPRFLQKLKRISNKPPPAGDDGMQLTEDFIVKEMETRKVKFDLSGDFYIMYRCLECKTEAVVDNDVFEITACTGYKIVCVKEEHRHSDDRRDASKCKKKEHMHDDETCRTRCGANSFWKTYGEKWVHENMDRFWLLLETTNDIRVPTKFSKWLVGQERPKEVTQLALLQFFHKLRMIQDMKKQGIEIKGLLKERPGPYLLYISEPGCGKSLLIKIVAEEMEELYKEYGIELSDVLTLENKLDKYRPHVRSVKAGVGGRIVTQATRQELAAKKGKQSLLFSILTAVMFIGGAMVFTALFLLGLYTYGYGFVDAWFGYALPIFATWLVIGTILLVFPMFIMVMASGMMMRVDSKELLNVPYLIVDNGPGRKLVVNATISNSPTLTGDIKWNAFGDTPGLTPPLHTRVVAGDIHKANFKLLYMDEIKNLPRHIAIELLTIMEDTESPIKAHQGGGLGNSETSSILAISTDEAVEANFMLVCLPKGTRVLTERGVMPIEQVQGERILSFETDLAQVPYVARHGERKYSWAAKTMFAPVSKVWSNGKKEVWKVVTANRTIEATDNHPFLVLEKGALVWKPLKELKQGDSLAVQGKVPFGTPSGLSIEQIRLLGLYTADGYIKRTVSGNPHGVHFSLFPDDPNYEDYLAAMRTWNSHLYVDKNGVFVSSVKLVNHIESFGLSGLALTKRVSASVFAMPPKERIAYLEGYIDGDGHRRKMPNGVVARWDFGSPNEDLIADLRFIAMGLGLRVSNLHHREKHSSIGGHEYDRICWVFSVYPEARTTQGSLTRAVPSEGILLNTINRIEYVGKREVYDITVPQTGTFFAEGVASHNCAGNMDILYDPNSVLNQVTAFRDRFNYGSIVYFETEIDATPLNELKIAQVITDELFRFGFNPMEKAGLRRIIAYARSRATSNKKFRVMFRYVIKVIMSSFQLSLSRKDTIIRLSDVERAIDYFCQPIEQQHLLAEMESRKVFRELLNEGGEIGQVNALAVVGNPGVEGRSAGTTFPIVAALFPTANIKMADFIVTGTKKEAESWVQDSIKTVRTAIRRMYGVDIAKQFYTQISFPGHGGKDSSVEGPSAGCAMTLAVMSVLGDPRKPCECSTEGLRHEGKDHEENMWKCKVPGCPCEMVSRKPVMIRQDVAITGTIEIMSDQENPMSVRVGTIGGVPDKIQGARDWGMKYVIVPMKNFEHSLTDEDYGLKVMGARDILSYFDLMSYSKERQPLASFKRGVT